MKGLFLRLDLAVAGRRADGNRKKARKLFTSSLMDPTGNSLAQAEWASFQISSFVRATSSMYLTAEESSEARAFHHYRVRQYRESIDACEAWAKDEPFSTRPLQFAAITASFTGMYSEAIRFAHSGLALEIENQVLLNALVFAHASLGEISEAKKYAKRPSCLPSDDPLTLVMEANFGRLAFRTGRLDEGAAIYKNVIEQFKRTGKLTESASAMAYLAREGLLAKHPDGPKWLKEAKEASSKLNAPEVQVVLSSIEENQQA